MKGQVPISGRVGAIAGIFLSILMLSVQAFPLHGSNGIVNATVYGIEGYEFGDGIYVDISASDSDVYEVELIDSNNDAYGGSSTPYRSTLHGFPSETEYNGSVRDMLLFEVPKDTTIKRLKIVPSQSDSFYIDWAGEPEAAGQNVSLKFYKATYESNGMRWRQGNWNLNVCLANNAAVALKYNNSDFALVDQFGWTYPAERGDELKDIPAGQSLCFDVKIPYVSEISNPVAILFKDLELNISDWA